MASTQRGLDFGGAEPAEPALTVSQLNEVARVVLEGALPDVRVTGEITDFRAYGSGHWYFTLKDDAACVRVTMFRSANRTCRMRPADGAQALVRGRVSLYEQRGQYQLIAQSMEPAGEGALFVALERLKQRLAAEGLFDAARKRPLPLLPRRIGVATSTSGAALHDVLRVLEARGARLEIVVAGCRVQGQGAAEEIACALALLDGLGDLDAVIVGRGGGSLEDLWAFNEEAVVRAIAAMRVPTIAAVGHEVDVTLADLAADVRAATPSQAAELVSASERQVRERLGAARARLAQAARAACREGRVVVAKAAPARLAGRLHARVERLGQHADHLRERASRAALDAVRRRRAELRGLERRLSPDHLAAVTRGRRDLARARERELEVAARRALARRRERLAALVRQLHALSPTQVLERGYAVLLRADGTAVRSAHEVTAGEALRARLARGRLGVRVETAGTIDQEAP